MIESGNLFDRKSDAKYHADKATLENPQIKISSEDKLKLNSKDLAILNVSSESYKRWKKEKTITLDKLHNFYKDNFHIEDTKRIDVVLAVALSRKLEGIPLWLILVGPSGDMKSVQLNAFQDENIFRLHNLTSKTLVNGYKDKEEHPDLAPELNNKVVVIPDMAQILKLPPSEKGELWGQLRDLYDGLAGKVSGLGSRAKYDNLHVTLLAGSTPAIDGQILVHQDLGTRELIYRTSGNIEKEKSMLQCFKNEEFEQEISQELKELTSEFMEKTQIVRLDLSEDIVEELMKISTYITYMRATAEVDSYTNELRNLVYPEEPTRIAKQMKRMFICLKSLDGDYTDSRALKILWHIAKSSAFPIRTKIFEKLLNLGEEISTSKISESLQIGKKTSQRELSILWNMKLVNCRREIINSQYPDRTYDYWEINKNHEFIQTFTNKHD
jgi:hypothetical protein|tara:strand:- start:3688 stop:5010 length:1323 start_codon:yes stop_codon:yes gene_type:complete